MTTVVSKPQISIKIATLSDLGVCVKKQKAIKNFELLRVLIAETNLSQRIVAEVYLPTSDSDRLELNSLYRAIYSFVERLTWLESIVLKNRTVSINNTDTIKITKNKILLFTNMKLIKKFKREDAYLIFAPIHKNIQKELDEPTERELTTQIFNILVSDEARKRCVPKTLRTTTRELKQLLKNTGEKQYKEALSCFAGKTNLACTRNERRYE